MTLKTFCEVHRFNYTYFRILSCGAKKPSLNLAVKIQKATQGRVNPEDFINLQDFYK